MPPIVAVREIARQKLNQLRDGTIEPLELCRFNRIWDRLLRACCQFGDTCHAIDIVEIKLKSIELRYRRPVTRSDSLCL
jgi:hypothetical protein